MKNKWFLGIGTLLVFGVFFAACPTEGSEGDIWSNITSLSQMDGTWKSTYSQNMDIKKALQQQGMTWTPEMSLLGDIRVASRTDVTLKINAGDKTRAVETATTATYSGAAIDFLWPSLEQEFKSLREYGATVDIDSTNHSVKIAYSQPAQLMSAGEIAETLNSGVQINHNGKKIKVPADALSPEVIFDKQ